ncbi:MAG: hypothetical protein MK110_05460 [Fuerstiella sp.]|nr:hypothetical protein [Fuerstiella sp.]
MPPRRGRLVWALLERRVSVCPKFTARSHRLVGWYSIDLSARLIGDKDETCRSHDGAYYYPDEAHLKPTPLPNRFFLLRRTWVDDLPYWYRLAVAALIALFLIWLFP